VDAGILDGGANESGWATVDKSTPGWEGRNSPIHVVCYIPRESAKPLFSPLKTKAATRGAGLSFQKSSLSFRWSDLDGELRNAEQLKF
jgi:hypothetical protein